MTEVERLRQELRKRRSAVTNKIGRIRRETGAEVSGTEFDPRKAVGHEKRLNGRQLKSEIARLNEFMARGNQFVSGVDAQPLPRNRWNVLQAKIRENNARALAHEDAVSAYPSLNPHETVGQAKDKLFRPTYKQRRRMQGSGGSGPYNTFDYSSGDINGAAALEVLIKDFSTKLRPDYVKKKVAQGKHNAIEALKKMGDLELIEQVAELSEHQFDVLWHDTRFASVLFLRYGAITAENADTTKDRGRMQVADEQSVLLGDYLNWAATEIPVNKP